MSEILYTPSVADLNTSHIAHFIQFINTKHQLSIQSYEECHQWSIKNAAQFWLAVIEYCELKFISQGGDVVKDADDFLKSRWFDQYTLNYAEHLLQNRSDDTALYFKSEDKLERQISYKQLYQHVSSVQQYFKKIGVVKGDIIAAYMPNMPETIVCMLAASSLGAIWSSCSPDFGVQGVVDRFGQIKPILFISADTYFYNGKKHSCLENAEHIIALIPSIKHHLLVPFDAKAKTAIDESSSLQSYVSVIAQYSPKPCHFEPLDFNHPLFVMYSSGTTGVPKCIVHGAGGTLIQHLKEHQLHCDFKPNDVVFYFTTCGWMMWNWLVTSLASGCRIALYDGSPFYPDYAVLWQWLDDINVSHFGTSAKYIDALNNKNSDIKSQFKLSKLRSMLSTGSPLVNESYDYVYQSIKSDLRLASMSGGTDILSCFALGIPIKPIIKGQLQCLGLGMDVVVLDDNLSEVAEQKGELSCRNTFPSKPVFFWNDEGNKKYHQAYFEQDDNVWCHGDYAEVTKQKGLIIYGRSDATLNPCGVRIGTAEIYRQVEQFEDIKESIVVGQSWKGDVRIILFVVMNEAYEFNSVLVDKIKKYIRLQTTPRHVPAVILRVDDIPRTKSGKIVELAVTKVISGETVKNTQALANPDVLEQFKNRPELHVE